MLPKLEHLIRLQQLENTAIDARGRLEAVPDRLEALAARTAENTESVEAATRAVEEHRAARATLEKELAEIQGRLSRFKEQLMAVKTNKEYQAMQTEIAGAEREVQRLEDELLERMLESDDLSQIVAEAEQRLAEERVAIDEERARVEQERTALEERLTTFDVQRREVATQVPPQTMALFDMLARGRRGVAVVPAHGGRCTSCQVRLRPQLFNDVRSNSALIQCESCQRILYFVETPPTAD